MPENAPAPIQVPTSAPAVPRPQAPVEGRVVDADAAPFAWSEVPGAENYTLQVAADAEFTDTLVNLSTGPVTELTLYQSLPSGEPRLLHWRVRAAGSKKWGPAARFHAASAEVIEVKRREHAQAEAAKKPAPQPRHEDHGPIHRPPMEDTNDSRIGEGQIMLLLGFFLVSFLVLLVVLLVYGQVAYPGEATLPG